MLWSFWLMLRFNVATKACEYVCPGLEKGFSEELYEIFGMMERRSVVKAISTEEVEFWFAGFFTFLC